MTLDFGMSSPATVSNPSLAFVGNNVPCSSRLDLSSCSPHIPSPALESHFPRTNIFQCRKATSHIINSRKRCPITKSGHLNGASLCPLFSSEYDDDIPYFEDYEEVEDEVNPGKSPDLAKLDSIEDLLLDLEGDLENLLDDEDDEEMDESDFDDDDDDVEMLLSLLGGEDEEGESDRDTREKSLVGMTGMGSSLEEALLQGVVPASAGVGSDCLPGDWGFDPLNIAENDFIFDAQFMLLQALPGAKKEERPPPRPSALILRDYREAEIRHGRLAMLAAIFWPLQEMLDKFLLEVDQFGPLIYGPVTLPYFPLLMTLIMMLLGYLDIYAKAIKEEEAIGDAFLPGDCFWDPLKMLEGAPNSMKRNMQERELFNGRVAMLAFAAYVFEEFTTHLPLISIRGNELLFLPAYQIPYIQEILDEQFSNYAS